MKKIVTLLLTVSISFLLFGCCSHQWQPATCQTPKTCLECGKTEGAVIDHDAGEWINDPDYVTGLVWKRQFCDVCSAQIDSDIAGALSKMHEEGTFFFSPSEFCERAELCINHVNEEAGEPDYNYSVEIEDLSGYLSYVIRKDGVQIAQGLFHGRDPLIESSNDDKQNEITKIFISFNTGDSYEEVKVMAGLILVVNPALDDVGDAVEILDTIVSKASAEKAYISNEMCYSYNISDNSNHSFMIGLM